MPHPPKHPFAVLPVPVLGARMLALTFALAATVSCTSEDTSSRIVKISEPKFVQDSYSEVIGQYRTGRDRREIAGMIRHHLWLLDRLPAPDRDRKIIRLVQAIGLKAELVLLYDQLEQDAMADRIVDDILQQLKLAPQNHLIDALRYQLKDKRTIMQWASEAKWREAEKAKKKGRE